MPFSVFIPCKYLSADFVISNAKFFHFSRKATTANVNAEKEKEVAITKANQEKETAQINAEAKLIEAQAQADANRLISQSLTPELIQQQMYEKWNGQLPTVQAGSDAPIIVDTTN